MNNIVIGLLAHVDAGKTTLAEAMMYKSGKIKTPGRVDNGNSYLDTDSIEKKRGITVFSKQAILILKDTQYTIIDTPGHMDLSNEIDRCIPVLDYAVLILNGAEGVNSYTEEIWNTLRVNHIPTFIFVNKTDMSSFQKTVICNMIKEKLTDKYVILSDGIVDEDIALCDEVIFQRYLENGSLDNSFLTHCFIKEQFFPVYFGSALKDEGIDCFLKGIYSFTSFPHYDKDFKSYVFKIGRDENNVRITFMKIIGGKLRIRDRIHYYDNLKDIEVNEIITDIRIYSGSTFKKVTEVNSGMICGVIGLKSSYAGQYLDGTVKKSILPDYKYGIIAYRVTILNNYDSRVLHSHLLELSEEYPEINPVWNECEFYSTISFKGEIQTEIFKEVILKRFGAEVDFTDYYINYKETISTPVIGIGHFEALKHYAEVHLLIEPNIDKNGIVIENKCDEKYLEKGWQNYIISQLKNCNYIGILTGSPLTNIKITLLSGKVSNKHTDHSDIHQAIVRAYRQALFNTENVLLEPIYRFKITVPKKYSGHVITDITNMNGNYSLDYDQIGNVIFTGFAPVSEMIFYSKEFLSFTHGEGVISFNALKYDIARNPEIIINKIKYNPLNDKDNVCSSLFFKNGHSYTVSWDSVYEYSDIKIQEYLKKSDICYPKGCISEYVSDTKEIDLIVERELGPIKRRKYTPPSDDRKKPEHINIRSKEIIIDGYNLIFSWDLLSRLASENLADAREILIDLLSDYHFVTGILITVVFDGYRIKYNKGSKEDYKGITVIYTKESETADMMIEKIIMNKKNDFNVSIVSSDALIQVSAVSSGVLRISSNEFIEYIMQTANKIDEMIKKINDSNPKFLNNPKYIKDDKK